MTVVKRAEVKLRKPIAERKIIAKAPRALQEKGEIARVVCICTAKSSARLTSPFCPRGLMSELVQNRTQNVAGELPSCLLDRGRASQLPTSVTKEAVNLLLGLCGTMEGKLGNCSIS